jgi:hypothetical protein
MEDWFTENSLSFYLHGTTLNNSFRVTFKPAICDFRWWEPCAHGWNTRPLWTTEEKSRAYSSSTDISDRMVRTSRTRLNPSWGMRVCSCVVSLCSLVWAETLRWYDVSKETSLSNRETVGSNEVVASKRKSLFLCPSDICIICGPLIKCRYRLIYWT